MKLSTPLFCLLFAFANLFSTAKAQAVDVNDSLALVDLYNSTNGIYWSGKTNWLTTMPVSTWYGVTVTGTRVTLLSLSSNNLIGSIPTSIGNLTNLSDLNLSYNYQLNGAIPAEIGKLANLTALNLSYDYYINGSIPASIGNLANLNYLILNNNSLSGAIPASIGNLANLINLSLNNNDLSGTIPAEIGNLAKLEYLYLYYNDLSGAIPAEIGNLANLRYLNAHSNSLSGSIPASIGKLASLINLYLNDNRLSSIPAEISNLASLKQLNLSYNNLSGSIPAEIGNLANLGNLQLYGNHLSGSIPASIGNLTSLNYADLTANQLSGAIPAEIGNLAKLEYLYIGENQLSGAIPASIGKLAKLNYLFLSINQLSGAIPAEIGKLANLHYLILDNNQLSGSIPASINELNQLYFLELGHNQLVQKWNVNPDIPANVQTNGHISYNFGTFNGLEFIAQKYPGIQYAPQNTVLPIHQRGNALAVYAGGTLSNNTYNWFKTGENNSTTIEGDSVFVPTESGKYYVQVTNAVANKLTLYSDTVDVTINNLIATNRLAADANSNKAKQALQVFPNPAGNTVHVRINGTATILLTNDAGTIMLTKTITNNASINVSSFAKGVYYIQNKTTGEMLKIIVSH